MTRTLPLLVALPVVPDVILSRNWIVDPQGKLCWEQVGFGEEPGWKRAMIERLGEASRTAR